MSETGDPLFFTHVLCHGMSFAVVGVATPPGVDAAAAHGWRRAVPPSARISAAMPHLLPSRNRTPALYAWHYKYAGGYMSILIWSTANVMPDSLYLQALIDSRVLQ